LGQFCPKLGFSPKFSKAYLKLLDISQFVNSSFGNRSSVLLCYYNSVNTIHNPMIMVVLYFSTLNTHTHTASLIPPCGHASTTDSLLIFLERQTHLCWFKVVGEERGCDIEVVSLSPAGLISLKCTCIPDGQH